MRILHTSDWHVGKVLKGQSRAADHIAAINALVEVAKAEQPDLVIVAGDLYDGATPTADSTRIVTRGLSALRKSAEVVVIGGNHDNGPALDALRPWADAAGITIRGAVGKPEDHLITGRTAAGEEWRLVALPFVSQRYAVRAAEMFDLTAAENAQSYPQHIGGLLSALTKGFGADTVNLVTAHLTVIGATMGGGEREAHTIMGYAVPASVFPTSAHYVALGHLHRAQSVNGPCPIRYSGSPLPIDFGEEENLSTAVVVDVTATTAANAREVMLPVKTPLRTVRGTLDQLATLDTGEAWLRVYVQEKPRAGLREDVQELLPKALEVRIDPKLLPGPKSAGDAESARAGRSAGELFADYLTQRGHADEATVALFHQLHDEVVSQ
ncbi:exonuclease SbcCD subunit D [Dactylosporangium sp. AC04546]|uniref:exonuclease SbcCD subunit D n=1 Tax=Dactylosporangium sp. AC04546 TaxID=2862460 RepID=UPI001EDEF037|nr:exonuclease SbcCD subunit D [Dactylosporangium sp. AC04546]WVK85463.1 exonuclease SbcCD subunit D [Dactylosporangium sp. AC04546]